MQALQSRLLITKNSLAPSGMVGVGWSFSTPFVAINHKKYCQPILMMLFIAVWGLMVVGRC